MDGNITGENDERVGLYVDDNNGVEHWIEMTFDGEIKYHEQEGYPDDPDERTEAANRNVKETKRYAQYYVAHQRGYETMPVGTHPDRITFALFVVADLSIGAIETYFGDLYQQVRSHHTDDPPVITPPSEMPDNAAVTYLQDLYLGLDDDARDALASAADDESVLSYLDATLDSDSLAASGTKTIEKLQQEAVDAGVPETDLSEVDATHWLEIVSGPHIRWHDTTGGHEHRYETVEADRNPDCVLQILPHSSASFQEFKQYFTHHLRCQIRDAYIAMGVTPPEQVRVTGPGLSLQTAFYQAYPTYQDYHDPEATVDWDAVGTHN